MIAIGGKRYRVKTLAWMGAGAVAVVLLIGIILAGNGDAPVPEPKPIILNNGKILGNRIISRAWTLQYDKIVTSPDGATFDVSNVHSGLFYKQGKPFIKFHAEHVNGNTTSLDVTATGVVHLETIGGAVKHTFDTDMLVWNNGLETLTLPHPIALKSDEQVLHVSSVSLDFRTGKTTIKGIRGDVRN